MNDYNEKIIKALEEATPDWNDQTVWNGIEEVLHPKKKKKYFFWLFLGLITICTLFTKTFDVFADDKQKLNASVVEDENKDIKRIDEIDNPIKSNDTTPNQQPELNDQKLPNQNSATSEKIKTNNALQLPHKKNKKNSIRNNKKVQTSQLTNSYKATLANTKSNFTQASILPHSSSSKLISQRVLLTFLNSLQAKNLDLFTYERSYPDLRTTALEIDNPSSIQFDQKIKRFKLVVNTGLYQTYRQISGPSNDSWINVKNKIDTPLESFDFSINLRRELRAAFFVSAGIGFNQTNELMTISDSLITIKKIASDSAKIVTNGFSSHYLAGELNETTIQGRTTHTPNRLQTLFVPLSFGYLMQKNKWGLQLNLGMDVKLASKFEGKILNYNEQSEAYIKGAQDFFNYKASLLNVNMGAALNYQLNYKLALQFGISYKHGTYNHLSAKQYRLKYKLLGINAAAIYQL